jgi:hypothetical protein
MEALFGRLYPCAFERRQERRHAVTGAAALAA